jgi:hypothetical protein
MKKVRVFLDAHFFMYAFTYYLTIITGHFARFATLWLTLPSTIS